MVESCNSVIVVGAGLVGSLAACLLAKRGYRVQLYEKREDIRKLDFAKGKSINLAISNRGRLPLRDLDLELKVLASAVPMKGRRVHTKNRKDISVPYDSRKNECIYSVQRNFLNSILLDAAEKQENVQMHFQYKLVNVDFEAGIANFVNLTTNETISAKADLIVGADGAFSNVRRMMQRLPSFTYSQTYIDHRYIELSIKPELGRKFMTPNHLHIWPRRSFMMIALPNQDESWTVTLFMPSENFETLKTSDEVRKFFEETFPDAVPLIENLTADFFASKPNSLVSIKCGSLACGKAVIIGDAAHAMVPFYGQGMNAGFEDCYILNQLLDDFRDDIPSAIGQFSKSRVADAHAISDLALYNYHEMRDHVTLFSYHLRKSIDNTLFRILPEKWIPLYNTVTFSHMPYSKCITNREWQDKNLRRALFIGLLVILAIFSYTILRSYHNTFSSCL